MTRIWTFVFVLVCVASVPAAPTRVFDIASLLPVAEVQVMLKAGADEHAIELRDFSANADPILNLLDSRHAQVGRAVATSGVVRMSLPGSAGGSFVLLVRARRAAAVATGNVWVDGKLAASKVAFSSGSVLRMNATRGDEILGVRPPLGAASHVAYLLSADGNDVSARMQGGATTVHIPAAGAVQALYASLSPTSTGRLRVYLNDAASDTDGDGLGDDLEAALGTCASATATAPGVNCGAIADPRDTDGDGLWDGWEVLGKKTFVDPSGALVFGDLPLPSWGANPRHKDIFVEVDFRRLTQMDNTTHLELRMDPSAARSMAAIYADAATTDPAKRTAHAASMRNPDGAPGASLHLDIGVAPQTPADATIYGDWGGYNAVDAVPDGNGGFIPQTPGVWTTQMSAMRRGVFHYILGYTTGGGSCGPGIACGLNMASAGNSAHEFGHTLGLDHNGPSGTHEPNCKPNYPSLMNYAFYDRGYQQFSDGSALPALNNHALTETHAIDPSLTALLGTLQSTFQYKVDPVTGSVDWNRDGQFAPAGSPVRAYANLLPGGGGGCEFTREGEQDLVGMQSGRSPAVVRLLDHLWVFTVALDGKLTYASTASPWVCAAVDDCPHPDFYPATTRDIGAIVGLDAATFVVNGRSMIIVIGIRPNGSLVEARIEPLNGQFLWSVQDVAGSSPAAGEPTLATADNGRELVLAYRGADNTVFYRGHGPATWSAEQQVMSAGQPIRMSPLASPALAFTGLPTSSGVAIGPRLVGAFTDAQGLVQLYSPDPLRHTWLKIPVPYPQTSPAIGRPAMAWTGSLTPVNALGPTVRTATASSTVGRFYLLYMEYHAPSGDASNPNPVRMRMSEVDAAGTFRIGLDSYFDNVWSYAFGIQLLQPNDGGLRAVEAYSIPNAPSHPNSLYHVTFRPHADGISDLSYGNYDDWKVIGRSTCSVLAATQDLPLRAKCAAQ